MVKIIKRISRFLALIVVYMMCAYGYLTTKGFIIRDGEPVLSNVAQAKNEFATKVEGEIPLNERQMRVEGKQEAPITIYGFSSMACSHCNDFHNYILPKIRRDFIDTGKAKYIYIHFPLDVTSMRAAKISYCLPKEKYNDFITELYKRKDWLYSGKKEVLNKYAKEYGMSEADIKKCDDDKKLTSDILLTVDSGIKTFGIQGTPSFIISVGDKKELIQGSRNYEDLKEYLNNRLQEVK